jgi:thiamine biosynthesis protein ThiI
MQYLVKLFPEIIIKSRPVRTRFIRQLRKNIKNVLLELDPQVAVTGAWDGLEVETSSSDPELQRQIAERLTCTPGINSILEVESFPLPDMEGILQHAMDIYADRLTGKTFAVRCKRSGRHSFKSPEVERYVGGGLNQHTAAAGVKLVAPDVTVALEIRQDTLFVVKQIYRGLGGFPLGCQDSVLSLISGGFDSSVSSYLCIKRGLQTHYLFFNLGGKAHELAVKEVALFLWMKYHSSHRVKFVAVPFEAVIEEILDKVENSQMGVVLKRMMLRAAGKVAEHLHIHALVTGESVAQVSSQTLPNLALIDSVADRLVLRPLSTSDKQDIIDTARHIGTEEFSKNIPEYCAVISNKPTTRARPERLAREEAKFDFQVLDDAISQASYQLITELGNELNQQTAEVELVNQVDSNCTVIDIRHPAELEISPLPSSKLGAAAEVLNIPFYKLRSDFDELDRNKRFLLYCDKGMMSRLHAAHLMDEGFSNVAVLDLTTGRGESN